jgi:hypothetical protein
MQPGRVTRRQFGLAGSSVLAALAGCFEGADPETDDGTAEDEDDIWIELGDVPLSSAFPIEFVEPDATDLEAHATGDELVVQLHGHVDSSHWHKAPLAVPLGEDRTIRTRVLRNADLSELQFGPDERFQFGAEPATGAAASVFEVAVDGNLVTFTGLEAGSGHVQFRISEGETVLWEPPQLEVVVE